MFNKFCYDTTVIEDKDLGVKISIENCFAFCPVELYDEIYQKIPQIKERKTNYLSSNDRIKFSDDIISDFAVYKLENYCCEKQILIRVVPTYQEANILVIDPSKSLNVLETSVQADDYMLFPANLVSNRLVSRVPVDINWEKDSIIISKRQFNLLMKYVTGLEIFTPQKVKLIWAYTKEGHLSKRNSLPLQALFHFMETNQKIIDAEDFIYEIHRESATFDVDMTFSIMEMFSSNDEDVIETARTIVTDCNREASLPYLMVIYFKKHHLFNGIKTNVKEFKNFMENIVTDNLKVTKLEELLKRYIDDDTIELLRPLYAKEKAKV